MTCRLLIKFTIIFIIANQSIAGTPGDVLRELGLPGGRVGEAARIEKIQTNLSWIGLMKGQINGKLDASTRDSIRNFQLSLEEQETGRLTRTQLVELNRRASAARDAARFRTHTFDWTGMQINIPLGFYQSPTLDDDTGKDLSFVGRNGNSIIILSREFSNNSATEFLNSVGGYRDDFSNFKVLSRGTHRDVNKTTAYLVGIQEDKTKNDSQKVRIYMVYESDGREVRGVNILVLENYAVAMRPIVAEILREFEPMHGPAVPRYQIQSRIQSGDYPGSGPDWYRSMIGNGSGSIVSSLGHVLTNHHVVSGCPALTVNGLPASLLASDIRLDLALVLSPRLAGRDPVRFADQQPDLGEDILVLGYPVFSISPSLNVTSGIVSSAVGFRGDRNHIQITAPIQPGNSGGPVISTNGAQVAVVVSKPSALTQVRSNIENIGWVIRGSVAVDFLERFGVPPLIHRNPYDKPSSGISNNLREWKRYAVRVECQSQ